jgi:glycine/D-amino acid oxidase-like deaminating enzyme
MTIDRREFLKVAGLQAGLVAAGAKSLEAAASIGAPKTVPVPAPAVSKRRAEYDVVVIGAGCWGGWTSLHLQQKGAKVLMIDEWGPGNSRSTSGDETRGVRSSYGDRAAPAGETWARWARRAMTKWLEFDATWGKEMKIQHFYPCGDLIFRAAAEPYTTHTRENWDKLKIPYQVLPIDEVRYRWPVYNLDGMTLALYEPDAGVVRARRSCESVAGVFKSLGGKMLISRVWPTMSMNGKMKSVQLSNGDLLEAPIFVFALGPWFPKVFPDLMGKRMRTPMGNVGYFGPRSGDMRFMFPNLPTWNYPGVTGWPQLPDDDSGFRVRTGGGTETDPDTSSRWLNEASTKRLKDFVADKFPALTGAPLLRTHSCHYEIGTSRNFMVDRHPQMENVWLAGSGQAEGFKMGPVIGEYIANRVLNKDAEPELAAQFKVPTQLISEVPAGRGGAGGGRGGQGGGQGGGRAGQPGTPAAPPPKPPPKPPLDGELDAEVA